MLINPGDVGLALDTQYGAPLAFLLPSGFSGLSARPWQAPAAFKSRIQFHYTEWAGRVPRGAAFFTLLRRAGTHTWLSKLDPGSAARHAARAARCAASGARRNYSAAIWRGAGGGLARSAASCA